MMNAPEDYSAGLRQVQVQSLDDIFLLPIWGFDEDWAQHEALAETKDGKLLQSRLEQFGPDAANRWFDLAVEHRGLNGLTLQGRRSGSEVEQLWRANAAIIEGMAAYAKCPEVANA
ncbi:hypothetical protein CLV79_11528 [Limimaricola soesokkakensis]|uniref:Uncharacterized protein n=1 Tax=Limimaricola soesokkakensis TaxID=1343159 RepID=A0A1X7A1B6_9RHOB|nr:hypothetical protein [Limimaricola soesokkakensis]PSK81560.1 hypothetical protein CLV79_11528 [Limimaricola soesokkakensis]SLN67243.1 hypothetical protein LOS8367_03351 [Limimaricola soesokkakensis]